MTRTTLIIVVLTLSGCHTGQEQPSPDVIWMPMQTSPTTVFTPQGPVFISPMANGSYMVI